MNFLDAWILMYGLLYIFNAIFKPDFLLKPNVPKFLQIFFFLCFGVVIISSLYFDNNILFIVLGCFMSVGWVASYYSLVLWNVPAEHQPLAQMSMAFLDLIASVIFFSKVIIF